MSVNPTFNPHFTPSLRFRKKLPFALQHDTIRQEAMAMFPVHLDVSFGGDSDGARSPPRSSACTSNNERRTSVTDITDPSSAPATSDVPQSRSFSFSFKPFRSNSTSHADSPGISGSPNNQQSPPSPLEDDENLPQSISANKGRTAGRLGSLLSGSLCPTNPKDPVTTPISRVIKLSRLIYLQKFGFLALLVDGHLTSINLNKSRHQSTQSDPSGLTVARRTLLESSSTSGRWTQVCRTEILH